MMAPFRPANDVSSAPDPLNPAQLDAVHHLSGPCLVLAGAGSGKTRVITHKIARLLQAGYAPGQIAAITFTNKAAQEMRERAKALIGPRAAKHLVVSTFHSLGVRILRSEYEKLGLKQQFSILDSDDVLGILKEAGASSDNALARRWQWTISLWKNEGLHSGTVEPANADEQVAQRVMQRYEERLAAYQAVDFDDLIGLPHRLLQRDAEVRAKWQDTLRYLLVDEYQDTNAIQYEMLKSLAGERAMFTAVGDDDQSIYGWRGATIDNLKRLPQDYPSLKVIALEQNYRSTGHILRAANMVIGNNPKLFEKKLWSAFGDGEPVRVIECDNEEHEAERVVARFQALQAAGTVEFKDFAVLYRANHQARVFEKALRKAGIPYKVSGGQSFFDRAEIKDLCAWLRLIVNNDDDPAFLRAVTTPKRGIGHQTLATLGEFAGKWKTSLYEALFAESLGSVLSGRALGSLHEFGRYVNDFEFRGRQTTGAEDAKVLLSGWLKDLDYEKHLHDGEDSEKLAAARWSNVLDFVDWIAKRCGGELENDGGLAIESEKKSVLEVAQTISVIISLAERGDDQNVVTLSTLHAAKGLEWPHVVLAGVNEGLLPFRSEDDDMTVERLEEERRLMYVGITRARTTLGVSVLRRRKRGREFIAGVPSRFVKEMKLDEVTAKEDPREKLKALRAAAAARAQKAAAEAPLR
ncbi:ATP-dependent helicase [Rhizobacter sp. Root404]|uniref:ATP-dependent helicase n=1 Tax=Rhizobacter sp. Root404 TaxID=1736528 RepID=UPI000ACC30BB|nr:UvrD-helicase domain-containing protein [Rhizobacter sp. Root404]